MQIKEKHRGDASAHISSRQLIGNYHSYESLFVVVTGRDGDFSSLLLKPRDLWLRK